MNRHQAEMNGLVGGSAVALSGGISVFLVSTVFLFATYLHWRHQKTTPAVEFRSDHEEDFDNRRPTRDASQPDDDSGAGEVSPARR